MLTCMCDTCVIYIPASLVPSAPTANSLPDGLYARAKPKSEPEEVPSNVCCNDHADPTTA